MDQYLDTEIDKRFEELATSPQSSSSKSQSQRSIIALAMDKYLEEVDGEEGMSKSAFKKLAKPHIRMFLYAGHDTTSSTLLYCYLLLSQHPEAMSMVRAEHDKVFGADCSVEHINETVKDDPTLLNQTPYTLAVIKEVLRVLPPAGSIRQGRPDFHVADESGRRYPTEGCSIWTLPQAMHHDANIFVRPEEFLPERWLASPDDPLHPMKGSWRPFEWGARACIGQTLAQLELKVALVMTARLFDITPAYGEWDELHPREVIKTVNGNRAYQAEMGGGGAHPADGFPVRITLRK